MKRAQEWGIVGGVLLIMAILITTSMSTKSTTIDETAHIPAGYTYWSTFDYRMNPEHPPFIKLLAGAPLFFLDLHADFASEAWKNADEWEFGKIFLFENTTSTDQILFWARFPMVLLAMLLGVYVYKWANELYGRNAGILAVVIYAFTPNILAHAQIVQTDIGITTFVFITIYYLQKFLKNKTTENLVKTGIFFGLALSTKYTGLYLIPIGASLAIIELIAEGYRRETTVLQNMKSSIKQFATSKDHQAKALTLFIFLLMISAIAIGVLTATYGFKESPKYITGFMHVATHSTIGHYGFLLGKHSTDGWWYYFPLAFLFKTSVAFLMLLVLTSVIFRKVRAEIKDELFLLVPALLYLAAFMVNTLNIGVRHILPIYPFLIVWASKSINHPSHLIKKGVIVLTGLSIISAFLIYPHYLAYFNILVGGPDRGHEYLIDSNIDWGQDLKGLGIWVRENNLENETMSLAYFGHEPPELRGITRYKQLKCFETTGLVAISVNVLQNINMRDGECSAWLNKYSPIEKIGYSIFVYNITNPDLMQKEQLCEESCKSECKAKGKGMYDFGYHYSCLCDCTS